jgi:hypothetical protein
MMIALWRRSEILMNIRAAGLFLFIPFAVTGCDNYRVIAHHNAEDACFARYTVGPIAPSCIDWYWSARDTEQQKRRADSKACRKLFVMWTDKQQEEWEKCTEERVKARWKREGPQAVNPTSYDVPTKVH